MYQFDTFTKCHMRHSWWLAYGLSAGWIGAPNGMNGHEWKVNRRKRYQNTLGCVERWWRWWWWCRRQSMHSSTKEVDQHSGYRASASHHRCMFISYYLAILLHQMFSPKFLTFRDAQSTSSVCNTISSEQDNRSKQHVVHNFLNDILFNEMERLTLLVVALLVACLVEWSVVWCVCVCEYASATAYFTRSIFWWEISFFAAPPIRWDLCSLIVWN